MAGELTALTVLLLRMSFADQLSSVFHSERLTAFVLYGMRHSYNRLIYFMLPEYLYLVKYKLSCFSSVLGAFAKLQKSDF